MSAIPRHIEAAIPAGIVRIIDDLCFTPDTPYDGMLEVLKEAFNWPANSDCLNLILLEDKIARLLVNVHRTRVKGHLQNGTLLVEYGPGYRDQPYISVQSLLETVRQVQEGTPLADLYDPLFETYFRQVRKLGAEVPTPVKMWTPAPGELDRFVAFI